MFPVEEDFKVEIRGEHQPACKIVLLDTDFHEVAGGTIFSATETNEISNFITDGNIDVDTTRGTRRTAEVTLLNPTEEFTPATQDFDPEGPWVGKIYLNRIVRCYRGVYISGHPRYVPVGTFMIDQTDVQVERNMSLVILTMSDLWKKLTKSFMATNLTYPQGTLFTLIIRELVSAAGADQPLAPNIDELLGRDPSDRVTSAPITLSQGDSRGDKLKEFLAGWDIDGYFDPLGRFVSQDRQDAKDKATVWHFYSSLNQDGMLLSLKRSFNDDNLYNHVVVIGSGDPKHVIRIHQEDNDPRSKTSIDLIGDRVFLITSDKIKTEAAAKKALNRAWKLRFQLSESIEAETICNPALEGDDVIRITEKDYAKVDDTYRLQRFSVPLVTSRQVIQAVNIIRSSDL